MKPFEFDLLTISQKMVFSFNAKQDVNDGGCFVECLPLSWVLSKVSSYIRM